MSVLYNKIEMMCKHHGINITQMCKLAGINRGNLTDLKKGRQQGLSSANIRKVANYFGVTVDYLLSEDEEIIPTYHNLQVFATSEPEQTEKPTAESSEPTDEDYQIIKQFVLDANPDERADVRQYIEFIKSKRK